MYGEQPDPPIVQLTSSSMWDDIAMRRSVWAAVLLFRLWNALFVRTTFNPDEYWQSTEVAHRMVFGYGHLTWEWSSEFKLRGFAHPGLFAVLYKALELLHLDTRWAVAYGPRILQGFMTALSDYFLYKLANTYFDRRAAKWALLCHLFSWFIFYTMVRPFSNSVETLCTTAALAYWPWGFLENAVGKKTDESSPAKNSSRALALSLAALGVLFRPTNAVLWVYLGVMHLVQTNNPARFVMLTVLPIAVITTALMLVIDYVGYGEWTFVPLNFIKFNILEGKDRLYGVHPWNWYFKEGYPAIAGTILPLALAGFLTAPDGKKDLGRLVLWGLFVYSNSAHKEFRFVLPLLPPACVYAGYCVRNLQNGLYVQFRERTQRNLLRLAVFTIIVPNCVAAYYLSRVHQRAPVEVMDFLAERIAVDSDVSIHFWTPCHATPYYSYLHQNVSMWFPDCSPANRERPEGSESHQLETDPAQFLSAKYAFPNADLSAELNHDALPSYVVMFSTLASKIEPLLDGGFYVKEATFEHSQTSGDADSTEVLDKMLVFRRA